MNSEQLGVLLGQRVAMFHALDPAELRQVSILLRERRYRKGELVFRQGDEGGCMYFILSGRVRIFLSSADGREVTICIYGEQTAFGEFSVLDDHPRSASAAALSDVITLVLCKEDFLPLMRANFDLTRRIIAMLTERIRYTTHYTEQLAFLSATGRVAALLSHLARSGEGPGDVTLTITQQSLAEFTNVSRELVNKILKEFADKGLISTQRGTVTIHDLPGLKVCEADHR
jgi:CRP-like cAMP-binding protein